MRQPTLLVALTIFAGAASAARTEETRPPAPTIGERLVSDDELAAMSGGESQTQVLTLQNLSAISSGNTIEADSVGSGGISFSEGALAGFSGIGNFVVNTGHNNTLQGAISVSVVVP